MRSGGMPARAALPARTRPKLAASGAGERPLRRNENLVLEILEAAEQPVKAYQLLEALYDEGLRAPMTIYRALDALIERRLVKKIASLNAFVAAGKCAAAFLVCRKCGRTVQRPLPREQVNDLFAAGEMAIDDVFIEAYGVCTGKDCEGA